MKRRRAALERRERRTMLAAIAANCAPVVRLAEAPRARRTLAAPSAAPSPSGQGRRARTPECVDAVQRRTASLPRGPPGSTPSENGALGVKTSDRRGPRRAAAEVPRDGSVPSLLDNLHGYTPPMQRAPPNRLPPRRARRPRPPAAARARRLLGGQRRAAGAQRHHAARDRGGAARTRGSAHDAGSDGPGPRPGRGSSRPSAATAR